ncbi:hypothetical protein AB205_0110190, partial [Aquarana catesbeiana]
MVWNHQRPLSKRSKTVSRSPVQGKNNQLVLTLNNVEMKHVGLYTCADKETGNIYSSFYLFIKVTDNPFYESAPFVDATEGQDVPGICPLVDSDVTNYGIKKCDDSNLPEGFVYEKDIRNGITIKNVQTKFDDCYVCTVMHNGALKHSKSKKLMVRPVTQAASFLRRSAAALPVVTIYIVEENGTDYKKKFFLADFGVKRVSCDL